MFEIESCLSWIELTDVRGFDFRPYVFCNDNEAMWWKCRQTTKDWSRNRLPTCLKWCTYYHFQKLLQRSTVQRHTNLVAHLTRNLTFSNAAVRCRHLVKNETNSQNDRLRRTYEKLSEFQPVARVLRPRYELTDERMTTMTKRGWLKVVDMTLNRPVFWCLMSTAISRWKHRFSSDHRS